MAELCQDCPIRGSCGNTLAGVDTVEVFDGLDHATISRFVDIDDNSSELFSDTTDSDSELIEQVEYCSGPVDRLVNNRRQLFLAKRCGISTIDSSSVTIYQGKEFRRVIYHESGQAQLDSVIYAVEIGDRLRSVSHKILLGTIPGIGLLAVGAEKQDTRVSLSGLGLIALSGLAVFARQIRFIRTYKKTEPKSKDL